MKVQTTEQERSVRLTTCGNCEFKSSEFLVFGMSLSNSPQCKICRCSINLISIIKAKKCPKKKF